MSLCKASIYFRKILTTLKYQCRNLSVGANVSLTDDEAINAFSTQNGLPRLRGRPYLPGSSGENMPESLQPPRKDFPAILRAGEITSLEKPTRQIAVCAKDILDEILRTHACVLIKGLPLDTKNDFAEFYNHLGFENMTYLGGSTSRRSIGKNIVPASPDTAHFTIEPHNEMSYWSEFPAYFFLYCEVPPEAGCGGETAIVDVRDIKRDLDPSIWDKMKAKGILYHRYVTSSEHVSAPTLDQIFMTHDTKEIEKIMAERDHQYQWQDDGSLKFWYTLPATRPHRLTGEELWFNQAISNATYFQAHPLWQGENAVPEDKLPYHTYYGDGAPIEPEVMQNIRDAAWKNAVGFQMEHGDVIILDNMFVQHARLGHVGKRVMVVSLARS